MKWNLPNKLTIIRVLLVPVYCVIYLAGWISNPYKDLIALFVFVIASLTDLADGKIARSTNQVTDFGKFMASDFLFDFMKFIQLMLKMKFPGNHCIKRSNDFIYTGKLNSD